MLRDGSDTQRALFPFSLWMMLQGPGRPDRDLQEFTASPGAADFGSSSVAKLFQEGFFPPKIFPANPRVSSGGGVRC